jgi:predicted SnoaL-like aldol condensation-catalyzing enzyme
MLISNDATAQGFAIVEAVLDGTEVAELARALEEFRQSIRHFHSLFIYSPDSFEINDQFVEGEKVATRMTAHVKVRATGESITLVGINLARIVDGKIVEEWNTWEHLQASKFYAG